MTTDDVTHLRALLAEQTARAEKAEVEVDAIVWERGVVEDRLTQALAACAEMRAAAVGVDGRCRLCTARPREHRDNCALARTDLWRGMVAVKRDVVERAAIAIRALLDHRAHRSSCARCDPARAAVADLTALLDGGKVKP